MERKRERSDIVLDMLIAIQEKGGTIKPTHLMYRANLAHKQMKSYLDDLVSNEFVRKIKKKNYDYVLITEKGLRFVEKMRQMKEFEKTFGI